MKLDREYGWPPCLDHEQLNELFKQSINRSTEDTRIDLSACIDDSVEEHVGFEAVDMSKRSWTVSPDRSTLSIAGATASRGNLEMSRSK